MARSSPQQDGTSRHPRLLHTIDQGRGAAISDLRVFQEDLPQGSVLGPLLWLIYVNDIDKDLSAGVTRSFFADDVAQLSSARSVEECEVQLQPA